MIKTTIAAMLLMGTVALGMAQTYTTFSAPDGTRSTTVKCLGQTGIIKGQYIDSSGVNRDYVRSANGSITEFEPPGSRGSFVGIGGEPSPGAGGGYGLTLLVAGSFFDAAFVNHGYMRGVKGDIIQVDVPGATNTWITSILASKNSCGYYSDANHINHGFTRNEGGVIQTFSVPGATLGTYVFNRNVGGVIVGTYWNTSGHGYFKNINSYVTIDPPGSINTFPCDINNNGMITGDWSDTSGAVHGFTVNVLDPTHITTFNVPGDDGYTSPRAINSSGTIVGEWGSSPHGFIRTSDGTITTFDYPGASETVPMTINDSGVIAGNWADTTVWHGFIRTP